MSETATVSEVQVKGKKAKDVSAFLVGVSTEEKNAALSLIADQLLVDKTMLLTENNKDIKAGRDNGLTEEVLDRIMLNEERIIAISDAIKLLIELEDPVGEVIESITKDNGLFINKKRVPIGVVGMI